MAEQKHGVCVDWGVESLRYKQRFLGYSNCVISEHTKHGLAKSGFHLTGYGDDVLCTDCYGRCKIWDIQHNPYKEHMKFWPYCRFIKDTESKRYLPIHPEYQGLTARRRTFPTWPEHKLQSANSLAAAGFYYTGPMDRVECFHCGLALKEWGSEDDPATVHKAACPYCVYAHGSSLQHLGIESAPDANVSDVDLKNCVSKGAETIPVKIKTSHPIFQTLLNLGFDEDGIMQEMRLKIIKTGHNFETVEQFLTAIWKRKEPHKQDTVYNRTAEAEREQLISENKLLREMLLCKVCKEQRASVLFLPCGHLVTCKGCAQTMSDCCVCDRQIRGTVCVYRI